MGLRSAGDDFSRGRSCVPSADVPLYVHNGSVSRRMTSQPRRMTDVPITNLNKTPQEQSLTDDGGGTKQRSRLGRVKQSFAHASAKCKMLARRIRFLAHGTERYSLGQQQRRSQET